MQFRLLAFLSALFILVVAPVAAPESVQAAPYFEGKTVTVIVGTQPGGRRDRITRTLAQFLTKHIPGNPNVLVQNIPGGQEIPSQLKIFNGRPDGSIMGIVTSSATEAPFFGIPGAKYDPRKYVYIGSPGTGKNRQTLMLHTQAGFKSMEDVMSREMALGAHRVGHRVYLNGRITGEIMGLKIRWVLGYSSPSRYIAVERGEIDGGYNDAASAMRERPDWFEKRQIYAPVSTALPELLPPIDHPTFANTVSLMQFAKTDLHRDIIRKINTTDRLGGALVFPPGTPRNLRDIVEQALLRMGKDQGFIDLWEEQVGIKPFPGVFSAAEVEEAVKIYTDWRPDVLKAYRRLGSEAPK
ncbi:MAG: hypothetical protein GTO40_30005 [Deltaproteobacteria bacterium]|nr:hypothetical protein [Deltaproteobacteria bacterium]